MKTPGHAHSRSRAAMAIYASAVACTLVAVVYTLSMDDALTAAIMTTVALLPLLIVSTTATVWQLVRHRREIRFGRRELVITVVATAAMIGAAVAIGAAASNLS